MAYSSDKIGFWSVFALVTGSQIGSSVLTIPIQLAPYGLYAFAGWTISVFGAIALALVFAQLCYWLPKTGGPHVYIEQAFGRQAAFFVGWTYWVVSWVSTTVLIVTCMSYLLPLLGHLSPSAILMLEIGLLIAVTLLNLCGVGIAGKAEFFLSILKIAPLVIVPLAAFSYFSLENFVIDGTLTELPTLSIISRTALLTLWGFIGLETATASAGAVKNPATTIPRAVIAGTICTACLYLINSVAIMGLIPGKRLAVSIAPYVDAAQLIFGGSWHLIIALIACIACVGSLNAWVLTSGQISLGLAQDKLMPAIFGKKNRYDAPVFGLMISSFGMIPLLIMTMDQSLSTQILTIIDISTIAFLFVYFACCLAFFKILWQHPNQRGIYRTSYGLVALAFCSWIIYQTPLPSLMYTSLFTLSGLPLYWWLMKKQ